MSDPYRGMSHVGTCPRCGDSTSTEGAAHLVCPRGCGEWYPRELIAEQWAMVTAPGAAVPAQPWPFDPAKCPMCSMDMKVGYREDLRFDYCGSHGVWLDAGEVWRFAQVFKRS